MTEERVREILKEKGFYPRVTGPSYMRVFRRSDACFVEPQPDGMWLIVVVRFDRLSDRREWVSEKAEIAFQNPIAAATYANRHVIPALLAGKEST